MYPHERSLVEKLANEPFALIGVNSDADLAKLRPRLEEEKITWRSFWNGEGGTQGNIAESWNITGWPTVYLLDGEGRIRYKNVRGDELDKALAQLLAELKGEPVSEEEGSVQKGL